MNAQNKMKQFAHTWLCVLAGVVILLWNGGVITTMQKVSESNPLWVINVVCVTALLVPVGVLLIGYGLANIIDILLAKEDGEYEDN